MPAPGTTVRVQWPAAIWTALVLTMGAVVDVWTTPQSESTPAPPSVGPIRIDAVAVPLNPQNPAATALGDFRYAGGLALSSRETGLLHELSDIVMTGPDRFAAVGDGGVLLEARLVLDETGRLVGVADASVTRLVDEKGRPLATSSADAEGLTQLPSGDRLVSFEVRPRIWMYPKGGGRPRAVPSPRLPAGSNAGMEALTAEPDRGPDAYRVGVEDSGETWSCRVTSRCVRGPTLDKPKEFGLVAMTRLPGGVTAYLLRAFDPVRRSRVTLTVLRDTTVVAHMDLALPLTVDNFEGLTSTPGADGRHRFYLISDDNNSPSQRTLLLAFDWQPT
jgi:hypothetical protein